MKLIMCFFSGGIIAFLVGWYLAPYSMKLTAGNCASETTFIYDETTRVVISQARWFVHRHGDEHFYMARLKIIPDNGPEESVLVNRTVETEWSIRADSLNVRTIKAFRIAGPQTTDLHWGRYIDPLAEVGFSGRIYLFRAEGGRMMTGYKNVPVATCYKKS